MDRIPEHSSLVKIETPEGALPLERFTMEHLLYLNWTGRLDTPIPYRLAPFPPMVHSDLDEQLREWEILDPATNALFPDARQLFADLTLGHTHSLFGIVTFPNRAFDRTLELPTEAVEQWGMKREQHIVPCAPFLIGVLDRGQMITAVSTPEQLSINLSGYDKALTLGENLTNEVLAILDPHNEWRPRAIPDITVASKVVDKLRADPILGEAGGSMDRGEVQAAIDRARAATGLPRGTMKSLAELAIAPIAARMEMVASRTIATGEALSKQSATTVALMGDDAAGRVVIGPGRDADDDLNISFRPGTRAAICSHIDALLLETMRDDQPELSKNLAQAWHGVG